MGQLTIRKVDDEVIRRLKIRAAENGRSAEAELRALIERTYRPGADDFWERAAEIRKRLEGKWKGDVTQLIRESRDER
jgi:plasmid stability protein